jgi:hypothetical protein
MLFILWITIVKMDKLIRISSWDMGTLDMGKEKGISTGNVDGLVKKIVLGKWN